jgi:hypothetical protein
MQSTITQPSANFQQILNLLDQLSDNEKQQLRKVLEKEYRTQKINTFLNEFQTDELTIEDITQEVETVRSDNMLKVFEQIGRDAQAKGLTEEILEELLADES